MARKKTKDQTEMPIIADEERTGHIRLKLRTRDYDNVKEAAKIRDISISAYARDVLIERAKADVENRK